MKGPGLRLNLAVERRWSCPACGRRAVTGGDVTTLSCPCADPPRWMEMVDPKTSPRPEPKMPDAQTLTEQDLDRLGIEPLKEEPPATTPNEVSLDADASAPSRNEPGSSESAPAADEFGAGLDE